MTISSTANRASYSGNGVTTAFAFNPSFQMQSDLVVLLVDSSGNQTVQTLGSAYTISGTTDAQGFYPNGGTINFSVAPAVGYSVVIYRDVPLTQLVQHADNGGVTAASLDNPTDKLTMAAQRDRDLISRSLRQPDGDTTNLNTMPPAATRANSGLGSYAGWDSTGQPTVYTAPGSTVAVSTAMAPVVTAATLATARTAMGLGGAAVEAIGQGLEDDGAGNLRVKLDTTTDQAPAIARSANGVRVDPSFLRGFLQGFEQSAAGGNNTITWGPGACVDSTNAHFIKDTTASFTKTLASWAAGSGNGGLDTGASGGAASTPYFLHVILNPTTGAVDRLISLSATSPTLPSGFTLFRCTGWGKTDGSKNFLQFQQRGDEFLFGTGVADATSLTVGTAAVTPTLTVPAGFQVNALFNLSFANAAIAQLLVTSPDEADQAVSGTMRSLINPVAGVSIAGQFNIRTNTSAQIRLRADTAASTYSIGTRGFQWTRGRNS